jgi:hypothetical protein
MNFSTQHPAPFMQNLWRGWCSALVLAATLVACGGGGSGGAAGGGTTTPAATTPAGLQSIAVSPAASSLGIGASQVFVATGSFADGSTQNINSLVTWTSSAPVVASVSTAGMVNALSIGNSNVSAVAGTVTGTTTLAVTAKTLQAIAVTPAFASIAIGVTQQLAAIGTYSDGSTQNITNSVVWTTASPAVATVSGTGVVTGVTAQSGNAITATLGTVQGIGRISVTNAGFPLTGLVLNPSSMFVKPVFQPFPYPDAIFGAFGQTNYSYVSWTSSNPAVATIDPAQGIKALAPGVTTLTVTSGSITASATLTVSLPVLNQIIVLPIIPTIAPNALLQMTATGIYSDGTQKDITNLAGLVWSSSNTAKVTVDATGLARGLASGTALITATAAGKTASTTATVPAAVPQTFTVSLPAVADNTLGASSLNAATANTAFPYNYGYATPGIGVGCLWQYSSLVGQQSNCARGLVKFDLTSLAGKTIQSATLRLQTSYYGVGYVPRAWYVYALATAWSGSTITWNGASSFQHYVYSQTDQNPPTYSGQIFNLDQTTTVRNWLGGVYANNGFEMGLNNLVYPAPSNSLDAFEFYSSEDTGGHGPQLIVTYQ